MSSGRTIQLSPASVRRAVADFLGKAARTGARRPNRGPSGAVPERMTLALDPAALASLRDEIRRGCVVVTGSAGKGTTSRILVQVMRAAGVYVTEPGAIVCTNIFRAEQDREKESAIAARIERTIRSLPAATALILNADDPRSATLAAGEPNPRLYFGISDPALGRVRADPTSDFTPCPRCAGQLSYTCVYYAHLGHWACSRCGLTRPQPDVSITQVDLLGATSARLRIRTATAESVLEVPLPGMYNAYNALAAIAAATERRLPHWSLRAIEYGTAGPLRMERIQVTGHDVYLAVATSAIGYTEVLRAVLGDGEPRRVLVGLDDLPGAGTSWIWDVDFESLAGLGPAPVVSGSRAADLAVRLKYAGWLGDGQDRGQSAGATIEADPVRALQAAIAATPPGEPLWIVSTPAALAAMRRWLRLRGFLRDHRGEQRQRALDVAVPAAAVRAAAQAAVARAASAQLPGPQPSAPPLSGRRPTGLSRPGVRRHRQLGQSGAGR